MEYVIVYMAHVMTVWFARDKVRAYVYVYTCTRVCIVHVIVNS